MLKGTKDLCKPCPWWCAASRRPSGRTRPYPGTAPPGAVRALRRQPRHLRPAPRHRPPPHRRRPRPRGPVCRGRARSPNDGAGPRRHRPHPCARRLQRRPRRPRAAGAGRAARPAPRPRERAVSGASRARNGARQVPYSAHALLQYRRAGAPGRPLRHPVAGLLIPVQSGQRFRWEGDHFCGMHRTGARGLTPGVERRGTTARRRTLRGFEGASGDGRLTQANPPSGKLGAVHNATQ